jgi:deoxyadenosine/deoxycytidine kinase
MDVPPAIISISGLMGSGKTTLAKGIAQRFGWRYIPEAVPATRYLTDLFQDPARWAFETQLAFLSHKAIQLQEAAANREHVVLDRSLSEDWNVFARYFHDAGYIEGRAFDTYESVAAHLSAQLPAPSLIVFCKCSVATASSRIEARGRSYQKLYPPDHLDTIATLYEDWLARVDAPVYALDSDRTDWRDHGILDEIADELDAVLTATRTGPIQLSLFSRHPTPHPAPELRHLSPLTNGLISRGVTRDTSIRRQRTRQRGYPLGYIAAPFTGQAEVQEYKGPVATLFGIEAGHGLIRPGRFRRMLTGIARSLMSLGVSPLLPHRDINKWGKRKLSAEKVMAECHDEVVASDCFVGILGESHGSHCEYGIARGLGKPCIVIRCEEIPESFLASGIRSSTDGVLVLRCSTMSAVPSSLKSNDVRDFLGAYVPLHGELR